MGIEGWSLWKLNSFRLGLVGEIIKDKMEI